MMNEGVGGAHKEKGLKEVFVSSKRMNEGMRKRRRRRKIRKTTAARVRPHMLLVRPHTQVVRPHKPRVRPHKLGASKSFFFSYF